MKSIHNTIQHQPSVDVTDDTSDTLLCAHTLAQPVCTAADSPTANSGRGIMNARRSIRGRWRSIAVLTVFAAILAVCIAPTLASWADVSDLSFTPQTPDNGATIGDNHTTINVSIATSELTYFAFNWNGVNYTYTTCGTEWDGSENSSHDRTTLADTPPVDFNNTFPWSHIRRCTLQDDGTVNYYLNATNSSLKATGGLADLTGGDGQVMVEIPKFYVNHTYEEPATHGWKISRFNTSEFTVHNAFVKNGTEVDYRYIGAYEGSDDGAKLCSVSGADPKTDETRAWFRDRAKARGGGWRQQDFDLISAVQLLYLIEYADFDSQTMIGLGRTQGQVLGQCGKSNSDGDGTNSVDIADDTSYMTYRGIENFYGNVWKWVDGINIAGNYYPYVCNDDAYWSDDTIDNYADLGVTLSGYGYPTALANTDRGFLPTTTIGGSASTYICDYYVRASTNVVVALGGSAADTTNAGAFCMYTCTPTKIDPSIGGRLAY